MTQLVLVRHGQSEWNLQNRFTGWVDVDLTEAGIKEAKKAGDLLKAEGIEFDAAFTSYLRRAIRTLWFTLEGIESLDAGNIDPSSFLDRGNHPRYKNRLNLSSLLKRFRGRR